MAAIPKDNWQIEKLTPVPHPAEKGQATPLDAYKGKVVLIVNTASKCGFTPQYEGLEALYKKLKTTYGDDFTILGFPCNQFGGQEPGTDDDIQSFCQINYGVSFTIVRSPPLLVKMGGALSLIQHANTSTLDGQNRRERR